MGSPALIPTVAGTRAWRAMRLRDNSSVALVPTMGNLHAGHAVLIDAARRTAEFVIVSVFVNPTQFGPGEDYATYPRTLGQDRDLAGEHGADAIFAPSVEEMYPNGPEAPVRVQVPSELADQLCGARRPGHFTGVASVVTRLLNIVRPDYALFGEKDYQQLLIIRRMAEDLFIDTRILGVSTVREPDGLALSSRNQYLTAQERARAPALRRALEVARDAVRSGAQIGQAESDGRAALSAAGFEPEYFEVRNGETLGPPEPDGPRVILAAGWLGKARLIDNIRID